MGQRGTVAWEQFQPLAHFPRQNRFSVVSALAAGVLAVSCAIDLLFLPTDSPALLWLTLGLALLFSAIPLLMGVRYPSWAGKAAVFAVLLLIPVTMLNFESEAGAVNHLLMVPLTAFYAGWFYPVAQGRIMFALSLGSTVILVLLNQIMVEPGMWAPLLNAFLVSWICLEASGFLVGKLEGEALTDTLTGALNRRGFERLAERELSRKDRGNQAIAIVVIDFDDFKGLNDSQGHAAGDQVLRTSVSAWRRLARNYDLISRRGGDEFALLLPGMPEQSVRPFMHRLQAASTAPWSWGSAMVSGGESLEEVISRADQHLYTSKMDSPPEPRDALA